MNRIGTAVLFGFALLFAEASVQAQHPGAYIEAVCSSDHGCVFTNSGVAPGSACATLVVTNGEGRAIRSQPACSDLLFPTKTSAAIPLSFVGDSVASFCAPPSTCTPTVQMSNVISIEPRKPWFLLVCGAIAASSLWVYFDAIKRGVKKGPTAGLFNMDPIGWLLSCLGMWLIAFPAYLIKRSSSEKHSGDVGGPTK